MVAVFGFQLKCDAIRMTTAKRLSVLVAGCVELRFPVAGCCSLLSAVSLLSMIHHDVVFVSSRQW